VCSTAAGACHAARKGVGTSHTPSPCTDRAGGVCEGVSEGVPAVSQGVSEDVPAVSQGVSEDVPAVSQSTTSNAT